MIDECLTNHLLSGPDVFIFDQSLLTSSLYFSLLGLYLGLQLRFLTFSMLTLTAQFIAVDGWYLAEMRKLRSLFRAPTSVKPYTHYLLGVPITCIAAFHVARVDASCLFCKRNGRSFRIPEVLPAGRILPCHNPHLINDGVHYTFIKAIIGDLLYASAWCAVCTSLYNASWLRRCARVTVRPRLVAEYTSNRQGA